MGRHSRRTILTAVTVVLGGCVGSTPTSTDGSSTSDSDTPSQITVGTVADKPPSCGGEMDQLFTVQPRGAVIVLTSETRADAVAERLTDEKGLDESLSRRTVEIDGETYFAVETTDTTVDAYTLRQMFDGSGDVHSIRDGRSLPTVREVGEELRSALENDADSVDVTLVRPDAPDPNLAVAALAGVDSPDVFSGSESFEIRVATEDGERLLTGSEGVVSAGTDTTGSGSTHGVSFRLSAGARERFATQLADVGALDSPQQHPMRVYYEGENIWEGSLGRGLVASMESGDWDGELLISVASEAEAERIQESLGILSLSVPADLTVEEC